MKVVLEMNGRRVECDLRLHEEELTPFRSTRLRMVRPENWDETGEAFATVVNGRGHIEAAGRVLITRVDCETDEIEAVSNGSFNPLETLGA